MKKKIFKSISLLLVLSICLHLKQSCWRFLATADDVFFALVTLVYLMFSFLSAYNYMLTYVSEFCYCVSYSGVHAGAGRFSEAAAGRYSLRWLKLSWSIHSARQPPNPVFFGGPRSFDADHPSLNQNCLRRKDGFFAINISFLK